MSNGIIPIMYRTIAFNAGQWSDFLLFTYNSLPSIRSGYRPWVLRYLLTLPRIDPDLPNAQGETPVMKACKARYADALDVLLAESNATVCEESVIIQLVGLQTFLVRQMLLP